MLRKAVDLLVQPGERRPFSGYLLERLAQLHPSFAGLRLPLSRQSGGISGGINKEMAGLGRGEVARRRQALLDELVRPPNDWVGEAC